MGLEILINDLSITATNFKEEFIKEDEKNRRKISFDFEVRSDQSHEVTTLLYKNSFLVKVPEKGVVFPAVIYNYSTSITDLYVEGNVGIFSLELIEKSLAE